jgi:hypothetical protein
MLNELAYRLMGYIVAFVTISMFDFSRDIFETLSFSNTPTGPSAINQLAQTIDAYPRQVQERNSTDTC